MQIQAIQDSPYGALIDALRAKLATNPEGVSLGLLLLHVGSPDESVPSPAFASTRDLATQVERDLRHALRQHDMLVRLADYEFAAIMGNLRNQAHLSLAANKLLGICEARTRKAPRIGMALATGSSADADKLLLAAQSALQTAEDSHETCHMHDPVLSAKPSSGLPTRDELEDALRNDRLEVHYQPKMRTSDHAIVGAEALMRWYRQPKAPVSPEVFVPLADRSGLIGRLTAHALALAGRQAAEWHHDSGGLDVSVNVTGNVIEHHDLPALVASAIGRWGIPSQSLTIELTESALMQNPAQTTAVLRDLRSAGVRIAIDDFGSGFSSLAYFKNSPVDEIKIDKAFVLNMLFDRSDRQLVQTIIGIAHGFGLSATAKGVENAETAVLLAELGCDCMQGFHLSKPMPAAELTAILRSRLRTSSDLEGGQRGGA